MNSVCVRARARVCVCVSFCLFALLDHTHNPHNRTTETGGSAELSADNSHYEIKNRFGSGDR